MAKKIKGSVMLHLEADQFCQVWAKTAKECAFGVHVTADADYYNLLYQNGQFLGLVQPQGGVIYPFSVNPYKKGSRFKNRKIKSAKIVCISSAYNLNMLWGTRHPILIYDRDGTPCNFGANGTLFLELDPGDGGRNADCLYRKLFSQGDESSMTVEAVRDKLKPAFVEEIGAKVQECLEEMDRPLTQLTGLTPKEKLEVSKKAYEDLKRFFHDQYGLTLAPASQRSIVSHLIVIGKEKENANTNTNTAPVGAVPRFTPGMW